MENVDGERALSRYILIVNSDYVNQINMIIKG
jgi:hypothetical protein